jgi:hypothetical protein
MPGMRSRLDRKSGTQNEWLTSLLTSRSCTGRPTGTTISGPRPGSPVTTTSSSRYTNCHDHWNPTTSILATGSGSRSLTRSWVATLTPKSTATTRTGTTE